MSLPPIPPEIFTAIMVLFVTILSAIASIFHKASRGKGYHLAWILSDFLFSLLAGFLAYSAFPLLAGILPAWVTLYIFVAAAAHLGSKLFKLAEDLFITRFKELTGSSLD